MNRPRRLCPAFRSPCRSVVVGAVVSLVASASCLASVAGAADRVYWATLQPAPQIAFANLDGSGGGDLPTTGAAPGYTGGVAIDAAAGRIYFGNSQFDKISFANLDGSGGGGDLNTTGATVNGPDGLAIDPAAGRVYWANYDGNKISFANLDGGGGGDINTTGATTSAPLGVAVDPAGGRIYWANNGGTEISFARLDGSGGGDLDISGIAGSSPWGVALDIAAGRIYWGNNGAGEISFANLDGSGGAGNLARPGTSSYPPGGVAIDPEAGRIYWGPAGVSFAALDGSGGAALNVSGATQDEPDHLALLKRPAGAGAPAITGGSVPGSVLSCSPGNWAPDLLGAFLYRVPQSFAYQWTLDGGELSGATANTHRAETTGTYRCIVTASNAAGGRSQTSAPHIVSLPAFGVDTLVTVKLARKRIAAKGPLPVIVSNENSFAISGELSGATAKRVAAARQTKRRIKLRAKAFTLGAGAERTVKLKLPKPLRRLLKRKRKLSLRLTAKLRDPAGNTRTVKKKVSPKLKRNRHR